MSSDLSTAWLASIALKTVVLLVAGRLVARALVRRSAATRYAVLSATLAGSLLLPLAALLDLPALVELPVPGSAMLGGAVAPGEVAADERTPARARPDGATEGEGETPWEVALPPTVVHEGTRLAVGVWLLGVLLVIGAHGRAQLAARRLVRRATPVHEGEVATVWAALLARTAPAQSVELRTTRELDAPAVVGLLRPVVLVPADAGTWEAAALEQALAHELAHVRRRDAVTGLVGTLARAVHWYNPLVHATVRAFAREREHACDDHVILAGAEPAEYASLLLRCAARIPSHRVGLRAAFSGGALSLNGMSEVESRLRAILDERMPRGAVSWRVAGACLVGSLALVLCVATTELSAASPALLVPAPAPLAAPRLPAGGDQFPVRRDSSERLPAAEPDLRGDSVASPRSELLRAADGEFDAVRRAALAAVRRYRRGPDAPLAERLGRAVHRVPRTDDDLVRERAAWVLLNGRDERLVEPLVDAMADADWRVRAYAAWGLSMAGPSVTRDRRAQERLVAALRDPIWRVRSAAAFALWEIGDSSAVAPMRHALADAAWQVRLPAVEYVARRGDRAAIHAMLHDRHVAVRAAAEEAVRLPQARR